jgi:hypothetical protein
MNETDRRDVLRNAGLAVTVAAIGDPLAATQAPKAALKQILVSRQEVPNPEGMLQTIEQIVAQAVRPK